MSDEIDSTIVIRPGGPASDVNLDSTVLIPRPGEQTSTASKPVSNLTPPLAEPADWAINQGLNPLVTAASVILTVSHRLRSCLEHDNVQGLQQQLIDELKQFETDAKSRQVAPEKIVSARYLLCTLLDEIVLNTPWGASSPWSAHSLLSQFHNETSGGEKCFVLLQRMLEEPAQHLEVLELFYLALSLGFEGKYKLDPRGRENLQHISSTLYQTISNFRGDFDHQLSPHWTSQATEKRSLLQYIPLWVIASGALLLFVLIFSGFRLWLYQATAPTAQRLHELTQMESPTDKSSVNMRIPSTSTSL